jgi:hypothetical protein
VFILYLIMAYDSDVSSTSSGVISPLVFTFILAYFTSAMFCEIFGNTYFYINNNTYTYTSNNNYNHNHN